MTLLSLLKKQCIESFKMKTSSLSGDADWDSVGECQRSKLQLQRALSE